MCKIQGKNNQPITALDSTDYSHFPEEEQLFQVLKSALSSVSIADMKPGDIVLLRVDGRNQHLGLIGDYGVEDLSLIHAYAPARKVVEHRLDLDWLQRIQAVFRV